jgi:hypothetical protein
MIGFKHFMEVEQDAAYWANKYGTSVTGSHNLGSLRDKIKVADQRTQVPTYNTQSQGSTATLAGPAPASINKVLNPTEVSRLGLHPDHRDVFQGSTADAPDVYRYVYVRRLNKYMTNPNFKG